MKPLKPLDASDNDRRPSYDLAERKDAYSLAALERLLGDCEDQPAWRDWSDLCCLYYDMGGVYSPEQERAFIQAKLEPRKINLVGRVINGVLGQEAKTRRDPRLEPDDDEYADVADALNVKLAEAQRETRADMAVSNAYASQVKAGIGWVEVSRSSDPLDYPYRIRDVHRSQIWWDWRATQIDLSDAKWLCRREWRDLDEVIAQWPEHREALMQVENNWAAWLMDDRLEERQLFRGNLNGWYKADRSFKVNRAEWVDGARRRIRMYEVWYRVPAHIVLMRVGSRWIEFDQQNPAHVEAVSRGMVQLKKSTTQQMRQALFAGPYRLVDRGTKMRRFPYVPFFAFRADQDSTPYGLIHGMVAPQDEFNERRMRIQWMLRAQQLQIDSDALDEEYNNIEDITATMMRPDMVAVMNPNRVRAEGMQFRNQFSLQKEQFDLMQDAKQLIQDVPGVYGPQLGSAPQGVTSGIAMNTLVEQGIVAMGELNDNYAHARRQVFDLLVDLIADDHSEPDMQVRLGSGQTRRVILLNTMDPETGEPMNRVDKSKVTTGLAEVPSTPAYMMQMSQMMGDMIRALAGTPQAALLIPTWVEQTSAFGPGRKQLADDMRRMGGMPVAGDRQGQEEWQAMQIEQAKQQGELAAAAAQAKIQRDATNAELNAARAQLAQGQTVKVMAQAQEIAAEAQQPTEDDLIAEVLNEARLPRAA
jgi:hypothetical protein